MKPEIKATRSPTDQSAACSPLIGHKFEFVAGKFDMRTGKLVAVQRRKYGSVELCFAEGWNIPFASIKLYSRDLAVDADAVFDDAVRLGNEIARRWNAGNGAGEQPPPTTKK